MVRINEIFYSIEGEGEWAGYPTIFIRCCGCNMKCRWCDTAHDECTLEGSPMDIFTAMKDSPCNRVRLTGGEPLLQNEVIGIIRYLKEFGYKVAVETNGSIFSYPVFSRVDLVSMDVKTPSSGEQSDNKVIEQTYSDFHSEFKFVINDETDLNFCNDYRYLRDQMILMPNACMPNEDKLKIMEHVKDRYPRARYCVRLQDVLGVR